MHSPKLRPPVIEQQDEGSTRIIRRCLLVWAILRLIVSVLWTGLITLGTIGMLQQDVPEKSSPNYNHYRTYLWTYAYAILAQLVEIGMIVTFITAGIKKSVKLYRAYYRYCILSLIIYVIAVILSFTLDYYGYAHTFIQVYLTYHIDELPIIGDFFYFYVAFFLTAIFDVGLEIGLIISIKKLIQRYSFTPPENV